MTPIDLTSLADKVGFKTTLEESAELDNSRADKAWQVRVPGHNPRAFISPWSQTKLAAYVPSAHTHDRLKAIPVTENSTGTHGSIMIETRLRSPLDKENHQCHSATISVRR